MGGQFGRRDAVNQAINIQAMELVWLPRAQRELQNIFEYYAREAGEAVGSKLVLRIVRSAELLIDFPRLGKPSQYAAEVRELQVPQLPFLLPYRLREKRIEILTVFDERRHRPSNWPAT
jgi:plasmid stabilization system protein ParE